MITQGGIEMPEGFVSVKDCARMTGLSESTLRRWDYKGLISPRRIQFGKSSYRAYSLEDVRVIIAWTTHRTMKYKNILEDKQP